MQFKSLKSFTAGFYEPSLFHIHIDGDVKLDDWKSWDEDSLYAFFHEYIHFLQDIMTCFGLYNMYVNGEYISYATNTIYPLKSGEFKVPIPIVPGPNKVYDNKQIKSITLAYSELLPNNQEHPMNILGVPKEYKRSVPIWGGSIQVEDYKVSALQGNFSIGGFQILESMAYLAQKAIYGSSMPYKAPNYPYDVVEQIARKVITPLPDSQEFSAFLFGLCHVSLMTSNPAKTFTHLLEETKSKQPLADWKVTLEEFYRNTYVKDLNGQVKTIIQAVDTFKIIALQNLDKQLYTPEHLLVRKWYHNAIEEMCAWWQANPMLLVDLLTFGPLKTNSIFTTFIERIGTPLLTNIHDESYIYQPKNIDIPLKQHARLMAAGSIISTLEDADFKCGLYDYCKKRGCCVDDRCLTSPWKRARRFFPCPYGHLWYGWGLSKFNPVK